MSLMIGGATRRRWIGQVRRQYIRVLSGSLISLVILGWGVSVSAQIAYTVFPAKPTDGAQSQPTSHGAELRVTLTVRDSTVEYVVNEIARQGHLRPFYGYRYPSLAKRIAVQFKEASVTDAFSTALKGTGLVAKLTSDGETVVIGNQGGVASASARSFTGIVAGRVTDSASGQGLAGASVKIAGTALSSVTSDSGHFTLKNVPSGNQVLTVKLFGYRPAERMVTVVDSQRTMVHVVLVSVPTVLSGVVTTATGQQRKIEVGNDITTLNVDSIRQVAPITSVTDLLETRVSGMTVLHSSGQPGDPSRLRLRGSGSVQLNNDPIVIVDGVRVYARQSDPRNMNQSATAYGGNTQTDKPTIQSQTGGYTAPSPLDQIDPASIETIEVLKGPSATATYGSDAAAGVIVITTKHGRAGPTQWNLALADGVNWLPGNWPTTAFRFGHDTAGVSNINGLCAWYVTSCVVDSIVPFQALNDPRYTVLSHGSNQQANLTVSGGVPAVTYSVTGSAQGNLGMLHLPALVQRQYDSAYASRYGPIPGYLVRPDNYTNVGLSGALTALPYSSMRVVLQSSLFSSSQQQSSLNNALTQLEGEYINPTVLRAGLIQDEMERATAHGLTSTYALSVHWQLTSWLPVDATGGLNTVQNTDNTSIPFGISKNGLGILIISTDTTGYYGVGNGTSAMKTLNVGTQVPLSRLVTLALGGNLVDQSTTNGSVFTNELSPGVSVPTQFKDANGQYEPFTYSTANQATYGWYVEPRLNVQSRFFVTPGFRLDGGSGSSSTTGSGLSGLSAFPKLDLSYVAVDRGGNRPLWGIVSLLRPRFSFGLAGIQPQPQDKLRLFNLGLANYNPTINGAPQTGFGSAGECQPTLTLDGLATVPAVCLNLLGNTQLRPERVRELEGGVDATLWRGRLSLTYTQYNKTTQDAILPIPLPSSVDGGGTIQKNVGTIRNTGTEVTWNATLLERRALSWNVGGNLSNDNSLVVRLNRGQAPLCFEGDNAPCQGTRIIAGYPLFGLWARPIAAFADANHDGIIEVNEIRLADSSVYVGQPSPKYQLNLNTGITLFNGRLSATATFAYQNALTQDNVGACNSASFINLPNNPATSLSAEAAIVASTCGKIFHGDEDLSLGRSTDIGLIQTVNTFRFNELSINYVVPKAVSSWFRVPHMTLALQGSNLALHSNYNGKDPDVNAFSTVSAGDETADLGQIPEPRTWWLRMTMGNN